MCDVCNCFHLNNFSEAMDILYIYAKEVSIITRTHTWFLFLQCTGSSLMCGVCLVAIYWYLNVAKMLYKVRFWHLGFWLMVVTPMSFRSTQQNIHQRIVWDQLFMYKYWSWWNSLKLFSSFHSKHEKTLKGSRSGAELMSVHHRGYMNTGHAPPVVTGTKRTNITILLYLQVQTYSLSKQLISKPNISR